MIIAVASQNFRTVTAYGGNPRRFILFETKAGRPFEIGRLELPREPLPLHSIGACPHPFDSVAVVIAANASPGFARSMAMCGVLTSIAQDPEPLTAVRLFLVDGPVGCWHISADGADICGWPLVSKG